MRNRRSNLQKPMQKHIRKLVYEGHSNALLWLLAAFWSVLCQDDPTLLTIMLRFGLLGGFITP